MNNYGKRPLWQWVLIYVVIGVVVYAGIYYLFLAKKGGYTKQTNQTPAVVSQPVQQSQNTVNLTSTGFSPTNLTIKSGQTVTWVNKSGQTATVNSAPHPAHTAYPPLNLGSFNDGGTLSLTFDKPGTYNYHNHLNSSQKGTITVQ